MSRVGSLICILCIVLLGLQFQTYAVVIDCCYAYTKKPLPQRVVKSYTKQNSYEVCDIDAIIFVTKKFRVCANPREPWTNRIVAALNRKKISKKQQPKNITNAFAN